MIRRFSKFFTGSNLKMYKTNRQVVEYLQALQALTRDIPRELMQLFILPSFTALADARRAVDPEMIWLGAQNMHWEVEGAFTGEISAPMLTEIGMKLVMFGHAERRTLFGETDEMVNKRVRTALDNDLIALVCVGETLIERQEGRSEEKLRRQLTIDLQGIPADKLNRLWLAYEPVWSIGEHGIPASPEMANEMHGFIRQTLRELFPALETEIPILYGGSVNLGNSEALIGQPEIDGLFIGRAAWDAENFNKIIRGALKIMGLW